MPPDPPAIKDKNGWAEWSRYVLKELERLGKGQEGFRIELSQSRSELTKEIAQSRSELTTELSQIRTELATLKVKSGIWGAVGASIPVLIMLGIQYLK